MRGRTAPHARPAPSANLPLASTPSRRAVTGYRKLGRLLRIALVLAAHPANGEAQTPGERTVESRVTVALRVPAAAVQRWLPEGWQVRPPPSGPAAGSNLTLIFTDRLSVIHPDGSLMDGGIDRALILSVPAENPATGDAGSYVIRAYTANEASLPGAYRNYRPARLRRETRSEMNDVVPGMAWERWAIHTEDGGRVEFRIHFDRGVPARSTPEARVRGGPDPSFSRIYRLDQGTDLVLSVPEGIDRVHALDLVLDVPELAAIFDGSEEVLAVTVIPWYLRDVFLP